MVNLLIAWDKEPELQFRAAGISTSNACITVDRLATFYRDDLLNRNFSVETFQGREVVGKQ